MESSQTVANTTEPDWDVEQLTVILEPASGWQLVVAGPGAGKSAVACQRIALLIQDGVPPSRILLISFTRTAIAELRDRIVSYAVAGDLARSVRISTLDSHAWSLRAGFDDAPLKNIADRNSFELNIERATQLLVQRNEDLIDFISRLEHLIIDEAQDVMGSRADLVVELLRALSPSCGVTILADPAQAIYGFTTDSSDKNAASNSLLARLSVDSPRELSLRSLTKLHRVKEPALAELFLRTRNELEVNQAPKGLVARVQATIRTASSSDAGPTSFEGLAALLRNFQDPSTLVLFRRRADVLFASSFCSGLGVAHRLRMSDLPIVVRPWIGWLLCESVQSILRRDEFEALWHSRLTQCAAPFFGEARDSCWELLHRLAASTQQGALDLIHLREIVARTRPPIELCYAELGCTGPILSTIHASKGREADNVVLVMPPEDDCGGRVSNPAAEVEEGRVYYVGATRARSLLATAENRGMRVGYLESGRVFRFAGDRRAQLEVGRDGDVDKLAHLARSTASSVQEALARHVGSVSPVKAIALAEDEYAMHLMLEEARSDGVTRVLDIGRLSATFDAELGKLWTKVDKDKTLRPSGTVPHLYLAAIGTVGLSESERSAVRAPFNQSAVALAPIVKGFPMISFIHRRRGRTAQ